MTAEINDVMTLNGLIFDLDDTLALTQHLHHLAFAEVFAKHGLPFTASDDRRYAGKGSACIFPELFAEHGKKVTRVQIQEMATEKQTIYEKLLFASDIKEVPGAQAFVKKMYRRGLLIAVASGNKMKYIDYILERIGIAPYIHVIETNRYVKHSKPYPDLFLTSAKRLGVPPSECIVFEDSLNGIEAANRAGITTIALSTGSSREELLQAGVEVVVRDYTEVGDEVLGNSRQNLSLHCPSTCPLTNNSL